MTGHWEWRVRCYYAEDVKPPKSPGALAIETVHASESSRDAEVQAAESRLDIGEVVVETYTGLTWQ